MVAVRQVVTTWNTINGGGKKSIMYFTDTVAINFVRDHLQTLYVAIAPALATSTGWVIEKEGVDLDESTGELVGAWSDSETEAGAGTGSGEEVADATQILFQWKTGVVADKRFVQGRTFIPGAVVGVQKDGNLDGATAAALQNSLNLFVASGAGMQVWHRPKKAGSPPVVIRSGHQYAVSSAKVWSEFAVQRRRRG